MTNYENILFDREAGFTASLHGDAADDRDGIEVLSNVPRELLLVRC